MIFETYSEKETYEVGIEFAKKIKPGDIVCISGDLGVGKTVFTKGFAHGLGIDDPVVSPTFTIIQVYEDGKIPLYHFDVYRVSDISEMEEIGYEEYFFGEGVCLIEWAELIEEIIPKNAYSVRIEKDLEKGLDFRRITV